MKTNNLFRTFLTYSYGSVIGLLIGFFTTMLSTRILNPIEFGKSSIFLLVVNLILIVVVVGTDQTFMRFFYEEEQNKRSGLLYNVVKIPIILSIVIGILILIFYERISLALFGEVNIILIYALILGYISQVILRFGNIVIRMNQKGNLFSIIEILKRIMQLILLIIIYLIIGATFEIVVYSTVLSFIILAILTIILERKFWSLKALKTPHLKHSELDILKYSYPLAITVFITWLFQSFDQIALRQWSSFEELGLYSAAYKIIALLTVAQVAFSTFWTPICYEKFEKTPTDTTFFSVTTNIVSFVMFTIAIAVITFKNYIVLLLGSEFYEASAIIPYLVFIPLMYTISETTVIGINFFKKPQWHILIAIVSLIINMVLNFILIPIYGGLGAAIGTSVSYIAFFSLRTLISLKYYKVNYNLRKIFIMVAFLFMFAFISTEGVLQNILLGIILFMLNIFVYKGDILELRKTLFSK